MRYEDLVADPMGELRRVYGELGLEWSAAFEARAATYLAGVRDYKAATPGIARPEADPELTHLAATFGHDRPAKERVGPPPPPASEGNRTLAVVMATAVAVGCAVLWIAQAYWLRDRHDWLIWPVGVLIGLTAICFARAGSVALGVVAAVLTAAVFVGIAVPSTFLMDYAHRTGPPLLDYRRLPMKDWEWYHILKASRVGLLAWNNVFWGFMGCVTAYRFASRKHVNPPGTG
jgi:hypothetical protein